MTRDATCPTCTSTDLLRVELKPQDTPMMFNTCRECENTWWDAVDASIDLTDVLEVLS
ncbi:hypothetical protein [Euzebya tangerina]|uniref:hypothetical protein n=1 Tax=Euzebya tangerina TaxID=591198 RepID=UPI0013C3361B|nr:hypothetical protein [Euzebya tangerina]